MKMLLQSLGFLLGMTAALRGAEDHGRNLSRGVLKPVVEVEEKVYAYESADNGAGPMWCSGSTCLVRVNGRLFASGLETLKDCRPMNNCRWLLFERTAGGWEKLRADETGRTREPCPLAGFEDGRFFLSVNSTLLTDRTTYSGPARPEVLAFAARDPQAPPVSLRPKWEGTPKFTEHSYRSFAADARTGELIVFQNIDYTHAEWTFLDRSGQWSAQGRIRWPREDNAAHPIRVCYPDVALQNRAVYFCGVSDIIEPNAAWRAYKKQLTGREWDYDFRRLFFTWTPDITREPFRPWLEIASRDQTCGWISPGDLFVAPDGSVHLLWTERALDERLRQKFFPEAKQSYSLHYAVVRADKIIAQRVLVEGGEDGAAVPGLARFQITPEGRRFVFYYFSGRNEAGQSVSENRILELHADGTSSAPVRVPLKSPFMSFFTATPRAGSPLSSSLDVLGQQIHAPLTISYARIRLE